jgi:DNA replication and repair protein RecF
MYLQKLSLVNFKNFDSKTFEFEEKINCFVGQNGIGKTNILDAIYYLSFAKSYFNPVAVQNIQHHKAFFVVEGDYSINDRKEKIICSLKKGQKKILKRNGKAYEKFSDHVGQVPLVIISPSDRDMVTDGSDSRRKFIDGVISQQDKSYLKGLIAYNKVLSQRNALLKYFAANRTFDAINLEVYDDQLIAFGSAIFKKRKEFLEQFIPIFNHKYQIISNENEEVNLIYKSQLLSSTYKDLLKNSLGKDKMLQYTTVGIHKDDLSFEIGDYPIKKFGSQGQQKSYLIALKFAQFEFIKQQSNLIPILLLDDIFDKLDEHRVSQIIELVNNDEFGQIFITDTHSDRIENVIQRSNKSYQIFKM